MVPDGEDREAEELRVALAEHEAQVDAFREAFTDGVVAHWPDAKRVRSLSRTRRDPWFEFPSVGEALRFGLVTDFARVSFSIERAGVEHFPREAALPWGLAKTMHSLSPATARARDARSRLDWFFADDKSAVLLTNQAQVEFAVAQVLPRWFSAIESVARTKVS